MAADIRLRWQNAHWLARALFVAALLAIVGFAVTTSIWVLRTDYAVLFSRLQTRDAGVIVAELERLKIPFRLQDDGETILVPERDVHRTRMKLLSKEMPLNGVVGFELFNASDFGMTEFAQKVNFQRALQGELTRTILSIEGVQNARVHLVLPEQGFFKRHGATPKASVTLAIKPGHNLDPAQVVGIQRLVAASIAEIAPNDVTVLDQKGVPLSRPQTSDEKSTLANSQLELKRNIEEMLHKKARQVLDQALGVGEAIATVDVTLNFDQSRITTEEVLPAKSGNSAGSIPTGVITKERQSSKDAAGTSNPTATTVNTETEYQVGKRVEQSTITPETVRRKSVAVVVRKSVDEVDMDRLRDLITAALGLDKTKGDVLSIQMMTIPTKTATAPLPALQTPTVEKTAAASRTEHAGLWLAAILVTLLLAGAGIWCWPRPSATEPLQLSESEREAVLRTIQGWLGHDKHSEP